MGALRPGEVEVGDGVTYSVGSDRYAGTVQKVSESGKTVYFTDDEAKNVGDYYGQQEWVYESVPAQESVNPLGETASNLKAARWNEKRQGYLYYGRVLAAGRHAYQDPHF